MKKALLRFWVETESDQGPRFNVLTLKVEFGNNNGRRGKPHVFARHPYYGENCAFEFNVESFEIVEKECSEKWEEFIYFEECIDRGGGYDIIVEPIYNMNLGFDMPEYIEE